MIIAGAGGFALQLIPTLGRLNRLSEIYFYIDENRQADPIIERSFPIIRGIDALRRHWEKSSRDFVLATGGLSRVAFYNRLIELGGNPVSIIDPSTTISAFETQIGIGTVILQDVLIEPGVQIGEACLINVRATLTHSCKIGAFVEVSPGVVVLGAATVGDHCFLGAASVVLPEVKIGSHCIVGAGAVVHRHLSDSLKVAGVPAKMISST